MENGFCSDNRHIFLFMHFFLNIHYSFHYMLHFIQQNVNEGKYEEAAKLYKAAMELAKSEPEEHVSPSVTLKIVDQVCKLLSDFGEF